MNHPTDWLHAARWGIWIHFLAEGPNQAGRTDLTERDWNELVEDFDAAALAEQVASTGAGYLIWTLGQNSGFFCTPNATYDAIVGRSPCRLSRRDLVADIADELGKRDVALIAYLPSNAPELDELAKERFGYRWGFVEPWPHGWGGPLTGLRLAEFQVKWQAVIREWSTRWGTAVRGWWFDGCYFAGAMYRHPDAPNFASFAAAARSGNPSSLVAFNPGAIGPLPFNEEDDYTAGEIDAWDNIACAGRWIVTEGGKRVQYHASSYLGKSWCQGPLRFDDLTAIDLTRRVVTNEGVVTWDAPIDRSGTIVPEALRQLGAIGRAVRAI